MGTTVRALAVGAVFCAGSAPAPAQPASSTLVFAAASTMVPLNDLAQSFERERGRPVRFSFAASSTLARQVMHGAGADLFLSANRQWLDRLERDGFLAAGSRRELTGNRLALIRPADGDANVILGRPATLLGALADFPLMLADPSHVPAGIYARQALEHLGLWKPLQGRLAFAANARAVTVRVARGEAPLGITYASELRAESGLEAAALLPAESHSPIRYELALIGPADNPSALAFYEYLLSSEAQQVFLKHGFTPGSGGTAPTAIPPSAKAGTPSLPGKAGHRPSRER
ncbi:MAG: molybdate ABC transporter substrate-binding protein [Gammaproteobacteria bacterium]|nr:molybdate ABC transporter substrate-binding protein [Gammaproteobacteria bacterium]